MKKVISVVLIIAILASALGFILTLGDLRIAFTDSSIAEKNAADYIWTDYDSQILIQEAVSAYTGTVIFAAGNGTIWRPLYIPEMVSLRGQGKDITNFKIKDAFHTVLTSPANGNQITVQDASGFHVSDLILLRDLTAQAGAFVIQSINGSVITLDRAVTFTWDTGTEVWQKFPAFWAQGNTVNISDLSIDGNAPMQEEFTRTVAPDRSDPGYKYDWSEAGDAGIFAFRVMDLTIDSVHVFNTQADGVAVDTWDYTGTPVKGIGGNITLKNSALDNIGVKGFESSGIDDGWIRVYDNVIDYTGKAPYHIPVFGGHGDGVIFHDGNAPGSFVSRNKISRMYRAGIKVGGTYWIDISDNIITGGHPAGAPYEEGIYVSPGVKYATIKGGIVDLSMSGNPTQAIEAYAGAGSFVTISGVISITKAGQYGNMRLGSPSLATGNVVIGGVGIWLESPDAREQANYIVP